MVSESEKREIVAGTIEHTRKMLRFLESLVGPSEAAQDLIRRYRAELAAYEWRPSFPKMPVTGRTHDLGEDDDGG